MKTLRYAAALAILLSTLPAATTTAQNVDWRATWPGQHVSALALNPAVPTTIWAGQDGFLDTGLFRSDDEGRSWVAVTSSGAPREVSVLAVDPQLPATIYAGRYAGRDAIFRSDDAGAHWASFTGPSVGVNALGTDPQLPGRLWAATDVGLSRSDDGGQTWLDSEGLTKEVYQFLVDGRRLGTLYASSYDHEYLSDYPWPHTARAGGPILLSTDGGKKWVQTADSSIPISSFALDPFEYGAVYAAGLGAVYRSKDFGASWENLVSMDPDGWYWFFSIVPDPVRRNYLYASTSYGVVRSTDGGRTWLPYSRGLPSGETRALVISPDGRRLHAGTNDGVYELDLEAAALDLSVGSDSRARLLVDQGNLVVIRSFDNSGSSTSSGPYGPYSGWNARAVADGSDGLTRVLWNNLDGRTGLQLLGPTGDHVSAYRYGPVGSWTAVDVSVGPDNTTHLLWTNADGRMGLGSLDGSGALVNGASYGPYSGWSARSISDGADGLTRVLWTKTDGTAGLSLFGAGGIIATYRFGLVSGWAARDIAVASDNQTRVLWANSDGRMTLWSVDNSGAVTNSESVYEPPVSGQTATRVSAGADGLTRVLWTSPWGNATVWLLGLDNVFQKSFGLN